MRKFGLTPAAQIVALLALCWLAMVYLNVLAIFRLPWIWLLIPAAVVIVPVLLYVAVCVALNFALSCVARWKEWSRRRQEKRTERAWRKAWLDTSRNFFDTRPARPNRRP